MTSQYDAIGSKYNVFKEVITSVVEEANMRKALMPYLIKNPKARILDLATGTGHYSKKAIDWGADFVLGVDLSKAMVEAAKDTLSRDDKYKDKVRFEVGDALNLDSVEGEEPFDIVLGVWLLNYASSLEEMTRMFGTIAASLKDGGVFIGLTPTPTGDVDAMARRVTESRASVPKNFPIHVDYYERLESGDGWKTEISSTGPGNQFAFRNFHLKKSLYEEGARRAGLKGKVEWPEIEIPQQARKVLAREGWEAYMDEKDQIGMLIVEK
ncbi:unnamed protein product [Discula destructiva]